MPDGADQAKLVEMIVRELTEEWLRLEGKLAMAEDRANVLAATQSQIR